jgi:hypothetical protein
MKRKVTSKQVRIRLLKKTRIAHKKTIKKAMRTSPKSKKQGKTRVTTHGKKQFKRASAKNALLGKKTPVIGVSTHAQRSMHVTHSRVSQRKPEMIALTMEPWSKVTTYKKIKKDGYYSDY